MILRGEINKRVVEEANRRLDAVKGHAADDDASDLTIEQLETASGMDGLTEDNLEEYKTAIANAEPGEITDMGSLKKLIETVNAQIKLKEYNLSGNADALTAEELTTAGLENIVDGNLPAYREIVGGASVSALSLQSFTEELQTLVNAGNPDVIIKKEESCIGEDAGGLSLEQLEAAGVDNLVANNIEAYRTAVSNASFSTVDDVQKSMDRVNLGVIRDCSIRGDGADISPGLLKATGLENFVDDHFDAYREILEQALTVELLTLHQSLKESVAPYRNIVTTVDFYRNAGGAQTAPEELQDLIHATNIDVIRGYDSRSKAETLTIGHLEAMGVETLEPEKEELADANIGAYRSAVAADGDDCWEIEDLQSLIKRENLLARIRNYRFTGDLSDLNETALNDMGLKNVANDNFDEYKSALFRQQAGFPADINELQGLIDRTNAAQGTQAQLNATGTDNVNAARFDSYKDAFSGAATGNALALQALVNMENALSRIQDYCLKSSASSLTMEELAEAGVDDLADSNLADYGTAVATVDSIPDFDRLQGITDYVNALPAGITVPILMAAGAENVIGGNLGGYRSAGLDADLSNLQNRIDVTNLEAVQSYIGGDATGPAMEQLIATGARRLKEENLEVYRRAVQDSQDPLDTLEALQELTDRENALAAILGYRLRGDAGDLSLSLLEAAHVKNIEANNIAAYRNAISDSVILKNSARLQALINEVNESSTG